MSLDTETRAAIEGLLRENPVVLFMKGNRAQPQCGFSARTAAALDMLLPDYVTVDVLRHPDLREGIKLYGNWPTIPQLYVRGELLGGSDIVTEMYAAGELAEALGVPEPSGALPVLDVEPAAAAIMAEAVQRQPDKVVHLKIDAGFDHGMSLDPPRTGSVAVAAGPAVLHMDPWTASRANGLKIRVRDSLQGQGFSFDNPNAPPPVRALSVQELKAALDRREDLHLFDVRGEDERRMASLAAARAWDDDGVASIEKLRKDARLVFHCHSGVRSASVAEAYRRRGFRNVWNLTGGIDAWSREIDPAIPRY
jgi:monothiol glutaredoxin